MATNRDVLGERRSAAGQPDPVVRTGAKALVTTEAGVLLVRERHAERRSPNTSRFVAIEHTLDGPRY
jgi:hypothetical protein